MNIEEYTNAIFPLIQAALHLQDDDTISASQLRYLYKQALYGYEEFGKKYASEHAQAEYANLGLPGNIVQWQGRQQRQFDPGGKQHGTFHLDHVYTLSMFDRALRALPQGELTVAKVCEIVRQDYAVAWILADENELLNQNGAKSNRGANLHDARAIYAKLGIALIDVAG